MISVQVLCMIETNPVCTGWVRNEKTGKFAGLIMHAKDHPCHPYMPLITSEPVYETCREAEQAMREMVQEIRKEYQEMFAT